MQCNDCSGGLTSLEAKAGHLNEVTNRQPEMRANPNDTQKNETATEAEPEAEIMVKVKVKVKVATARCVRDNDNRSYALA